jgi:hypothetical protein
MQAMGGIMFAGAVHIDFPAVASLFCWAEEAMVIGVTIQLALYPDQDVALQRSGTSVNVCIYETKNHICSGG